MPTVDELADEYDREIADEYPEDPLDDIRDEVSSVRSDQRALFVIVILGFLLLWSRF